MGKRYLGLNPALYACLVSNFDSEVGFSAKGQKATVVSKYSSLTGTMVEQELTRGEYYTLSCPYCEDKGHRLYVNYRFNTPKEENMEKAVCYLSDCLSVPENFRDFVERVNTPPDFEWTSRIGRFGIDEVPVDIATGDIIGRPTELPGECTFLTDLSSSHPANRYLERRGFDPDLVDEMYEVSFCMSSPVKYAQGRLVIPVFYKDKLVGWQTRAIWDNEKPKYYSQPGFQKSLYPYNWDEAQKCRTLVYVEGALDVWGVGRCGTGVFGKTLGAGHRKLLMEAENVESVVVAFDPDQDEKEKAKGKDHHIVTAAQWINSIPKFRNKVVQVYFPIKEDPGSLTTDLTWDYIYEHAEEQKVRIWEPRDLKGCR